MPAPVLRTFSLDDLDAKRAEKRDVGAQYTFAHPVDRKPRRWLRLRLLLIAGAATCLALIITAVIVFVRARLATATPPLRAADQSASSSPVSPLLVPTPTRTSLAPSIVTLAPASSSATAASSTSSAAATLSTMAADPRLRRVFPGVPRFVRRR